MKKSTQVMAALAAGSLAIGGVGAAVAASATPSAKTHTLTFKVKSIGTTTFGKNFVSSDKDVSHGQAIGRDVLSGKYNPKTKQVSGNVAIGLKGGVLYAHLTFPNNKNFSGTVTGGAGKFKGSTGTVSGTSLNSKTQKVTVVYK